MKWIFCQVEWFPFVKSYSVPFSDKSYMLKFQQMKCPDVTDSKSFYKQLSYKLKILYKCLNKDIVLTLLQHRITHVVQSCWCVYTECLGGQWLHPQMLAWFQFIGSWGSVLHPDTLYQLKVHLAQFPFPRMTLSKGKTNKWLELMATFWGRHGI